MPQLQHQEKSGDNHPQKLHPLTANFLSIALFMILFAIAFCIPWCVGEAKSSPPKPPEIVWTFDDGPHRHSTPHILDLLDQYCLKGTFFVLGIHQQDPRNRPALRAVVARGHRLGNHLWSHDSPCKLGRVKVMKELYRTERWILLVLKQPQRRPTYLYRPPHGYRCRAVDRAVRDAGYGIQMWHASDYKVSAKRMWYTARRRLRRGQKTILLFHHKWRKFREFLSLTETAGYIRKCK